MRNVILSIVFILLSGCATQKFVFLGNGPDRPMHDISPDFVINNTFWLGGLGQTKTIDIVNRCDRGDNTVTIETYRSFGNSLYAFLTLWVYMPTTTKIYCRY